MQVSEKQLRVAFDGDAVLFSDESEQIVKAHGLDKFFEHEKTYENKPLAQVRLRAWWHCDQINLFIIVFAKSERIIFMSALLTNTLDRTKGEKTL